MHNLHLLSRESVKGCKLQDEYHWNCTLASVLLAAAACGSVLLFAVKPENAAAAA